MEEKGTKLDEEEVRERDLLKISRGELRRDLGGA